MNKALFLDRDGVINRETGQYIYRKEDFFLLQDVPLVLKEFQKKGYLLIIISNQSGVAKGICSVREVSVLHDYLKDELKKNGVDITTVFFCPHHPENGNCLCRKPDSMLFEKALAKYNINPSGSIMVGDMARDIIPAVKSGIKGILVNPNTSLKSLLNELL